MAPVSSQTGVTESRGRANEFPGYEAKRNNEVRNTALSSLQGGYAKFCFVLGSSNRGVAGGSGGARYPPL